MTRTKILIKKLRQAIALAEKKGEDVTGWEQTLERLLQAQDVAERTRDLLATRGWCLWECSALNGDVIVVTKDELIDGYPRGYPVYTRAELELLSNTNVSTKLLVHEAKRITRAIVMGVGDAKQRVG
ncbi:hypothetical protein M1O47_03545 [Dehalococcoidia bacterium]|nr:hypothetical protein [Dehalococcoidia bacterium]